MRVFIVVLIFSLFIAVLGFRKYNSYKAKQKAQVAFDSIQSYRDNQRKSIKVIDLGLPGGTVQK
jgi:hypothetical protein